MGDDWKNKFDELNDICSYVFTKNTKYFNY